jgi:hypothetical protein
MDNDISGPDGEFPGGREYPTKVKGNFLNSNSPKEKISAFD